MIEGIFFELIRVAIGTQESLSRLPSAREWGELYKAAKKQSLVGICFAGIQRLGANADDGFETIGLPEMLYLKWMGMAAKIQQRNKIVDERCVALHKRLSAEGFHSCVLKGQGVGLQYAEHLLGLRQSGDIDIWMDGGFDKVNAWVQKVAPTNVVNQHHVDLKLYDDTEIEAHYHPINMTNPWRQHRLKAFIKAHEDECFANKTCLNLEKTQMCVPTTEFNLVFLMVHIFHHLFTEGVGLRQVMDYYFVLRNTNFQELPTNYSIIFKQLGLERFASAMMWVIKTVFVDHDNDNKDLFLGFIPNEKDGKFMLDEIMISGNFGKQDDRQKGLYESKWNSFWMVNGKTFRFWRFDHWAWFWSPIYRVRSKIWQLKRGYK